MNKNAIKKFAIEARKKLIASVSDRAGMLGITVEGCSEPISKGIDFEVYKTVAGTEVTLGRSQCEQRRKLKEQIEARGFEAVVEEVAYTWFNRICAIRFMEVNDYLPTRVRVLSSEKEGKNEPDIVTQAPDVDLDFTDKEREYILDCKMNNKLDELFKMLFIKQCNKLSEILPELFEATEDYTEMLLNISYTNKDDIIHMLVNQETGIPEADFNVSTIGEDGQSTGQVEIIGWLYQYYISEKHDQIINIYKGTIKKEDIPAATQLFTTDWVVRYMVDNSLGRYWIERNPESKLADKLQFFVTPKDGTIAYVDEKLSPTDLTLFDPCMGSGHILVYAFDVLMEIYRECGYSDRDAALNIVQHNLFGLDIDKRAYQLAYFAVMMKARSYNRRALTQGIYNNLAFIEESNNISKFSYDALTTNKEMNQIGEYLVRAFKHAREIGSLQTIERKDYKAFAEYLLNLDTPNAQLDLFSTEWLNNVKPLMLQFTKQASILSGKYTVVCTNPPYMNKLESHLKEFVVDNYKQYSGDLFSVFMYRNFGFCKNDGYSAFMTPNVWMFIKSYEALRKYIIEEKTISSLIQIAKGAFYREATVDVCTFVLRNEKNVQKGIYYRLEDFKGYMEEQGKMLYMMINENVYQESVYETSSENFLRLPGNQIAYWISENIYSVFALGTPLGEIAKPRQGMATSDNDRFLRLWHEVPFYNFGIDMDDPSMAQQSNLRWFPYNKGGSYRKWYGNNEYVVDYQNDGERVKGYAAKLYKSYSRTIKNINFFFQPSITWTMISSSKFGVRYSPKGFIFDIRGSSIFLDREKVNYILAFLSSNVTWELLKFLSPTISFEVGTIALLPVIGMNNRNEVIDNLVEENINLSKMDWDSYETSWDFKKHPLLQYASFTPQEIAADRERHISDMGLIRDAYELWNDKCESRFNQLKANEEELNRIFIDIYGLQDELTPDVEDKDVTVRKADLKREIKSLLSYAVGCMFGRYSLDCEGIAYAGGEWDDSKYETFIPDKDNCIPITDDEYSEDDIVGRLCEWLKRVYGAETLEENLDFIAKALGNKGKTSRETIREYFVNDFITDHMKIYQKRPIYWLFDSGKANGFKALVYIHRYNSDTVAKVRVDYLHIIQKSIEQAKLSAEYLRDNGSGAEKAKATKLITKYTKQLAEIHLYDEAMAHIANQRIELDLDDGVKVNYAKFQGVEVAQEGKKTLKIDLLAKI